MHNPMLIFQIQGNSITFLRTLWIWHWFSFGRHHVLAADLLPGHKSVVRDEDRQSSIGRTHGTAKKKKKAIYFSCLRQRLGIFFKLLLKLVHRKKRKKRTKQIFCNVLHHQFTFTEVKPVARGKQHYFTVMWKNYTLFKILGFYVLRLHKLQNRGLKIRWLQQS